MDISRQSQDRIEDFRSMMQLEVGPGALTTKIAMNLKNPYLFKELSFGPAPLKRRIDYAYAAGLISRAEADYIKKVVSGESGESGGIGEIDDIGNGGENYN